MTHLKFYSSVRENPRPGHLTHKALILLPCYTPESPRNEPSTDHIFLSAGLENNDLSCGVKERVRNWVKQADLSSQFTNYINFSMLAKLWVFLFYLLNGINMIYIKVFVRFASLGGDIYEESSIHQVLIRLFYWFSFNLVMLSCSGLKLINLSWF